MIDAQRIQKVSDEIARLFHPDRIILFGSYAYGNPTEDSDVDLLVVMPLPNGGRGRSSDIRQSLDVSFPLDLLIYDPSHLQNRIALEDFFLREITQKGIVLYEGSHPGMG
jgi:predicted nucleotidyltransferase